MKHTNSSLVLKYQDYKSNFSSGKQQKYHQSNLRNNLRNTFCNEEDDEDQDYEYEQDGKPSVKQSDPRAYIKTKQIVHSSCLDYYLDTALGDLPEYRNLLQALRTSTEDDEIRIWIDGPGGYLHTALAIIDSINNSNAQVTVIVTGRAYSAHSIIALAAPMLVIGERARFMLHAGTYGVYGKEGEIQSRIEAEKRELDFVVNEFYKDFLTDDEIKLLKVGQDYWFDSNEINQRLVKRNEIRSTLAKENKDQGSNCSSCNSCEYKDTCDNYEDEE